MHIIKMALELAAGFFMAILVVTIVGAVALLLFCIFIIVMAALITAIAV
jgi:hypothetical protein